MRRFGRSIICCALAITSIAGLAGCPPREEPTPEQGPGTFDPAATPAWPFWPTSMRIHPTTMVREDRETRAPVIEVRLEFHDQLDHIAKVVGQVRLELHDHDPGQSADEPIRSWNVDLRDLENNRLHWDSVTDTYLFRLALEGEAASLPPPWFVRAFVLADDGRKFTAVRAVK